MTTKPLYTEFAAQLRHVGLSQSEFARLCGVTVKAVNNWCHGRRPVPPWAWALARAAQYKPLKELLAIPPFDWRIVLGVTSRKQAKHARDRLAKLYHPDRGGDLALMQRVNAAYDAMLREC